MGSDVKECKKQRCDTQHHVTLLQYIDKVDDIKLVSVDIFWKITISLLADDSVGLIVSRISGLVSSVLA
jgi:hypothetical protein